MRAPTETMPGNRDIYDETVELLRDLSRNHAAAAADMCRHGVEAALAEGLDEDPWAGGRELLGRELPEEVEDLGWMLRELEDVGLSAVCRLARAGDEDCVFRAIDDAGAGWMRGVILNRAAETIRSEQD